MLLPYIELIEYINFDNKNFPIYDNHNHAQKEVMQWDAVYFISDWNLADGDWVMD